MSIIRVIAIALIVIGVGGFFLPIATAYVLKGLDTVEMPLGEVMDVETSADGNMYLALFIAGRIQKYTSEGRFMRAFDVSAQGGSFCLDLKNDRLIAHIARGDITEEFDLDGRRLSESPRRPGAQVIDCTLNPRVRSVDWSLANVTVNFHDRPSVTIARQPWHYLAPHFLISWGIAALGFITLQLFKWLKRRSS